MSNTSLLGSFGGLGNAGLQFRNKLINGGFDIWQRGTSGTNAGANLGSYPSADRWKFLTHTSGVGWADGTLTQTTDTPSSDIKYSVKVVSTSAALDDVVVFQTIEAMNAQALAGKSATLSFWCKKGGGLASTKTFKYAVRYLDTEDVGTNAPLTMGLTTLIEEATISSTSLSSSWTKITMTIPTIPSQAANGLVVEFRLDDDNLGSGDLLFLSQVQLEAGTVATPFEHRPIGLELSLARRYYQTFRCGTTSYMIASSTATGGVAPVPVLFEEMRITPNVTTSSSSVVLVNVTANTSSSQTLSTNAENNKLLRIYCGGLSNTVASYLLVMNNIAFYLNAEL